MNVENLTILMNYLLKGNLQSSFDMAKYQEASSTGITQGMYYENCGSVGCAVGHGPYAGIPKIKTEIWREYCSRVFGIEGSYLDAKYGWCFDPDWQSIDNTAQGAGIRIYIMLTDGLPDELFPDIQSFFDKKSPEKISLYNDLITLYKAELGLL